MRDDRGVKPTGNRFNPRRWRLTVLAACMLAMTSGSAFAAGPSGTPVDPGVRASIGLVLHVRPGTFTTPPHYVAGVRTTRGLVLLWAGTRADGTQCTGIEAAFGDADVERVKLELAGRTITDNGITCGSARSPLGAGNVGLSNGQGLGSVHVEYGLVPARMHALRLTFEDGHAQTVGVDHGWLLVAFERASRRLGHRPLLEQALDARGHPIASKRLNPWDYGGREPPPPPLSGPGSSLLTTIATWSGPAELRLSAPGRGWQRRQCWGVVAGGRSTPVLCGYPAAFDSQLPHATTNNLFRYGPRAHGLVIALASRIDAAWLVGADHSVRPGGIVRFVLARSPQVLVVGAARRGRALTGIVTSRDQRVVGALLLRGRPDLPAWADTGPCYLAAPSAGAPAATPACRALMATASRAEGLTQG
jgi:hypothetical protein